MGKSTAGRTIDMLRDQGWPLVSIVERFNPYSKNYNDLFGFADVIAIHPEHGTLLVQVTSGSHVNARLDKMRNEALEKVEYAISSHGVAVEVHGWRKVKICYKCRKIRFGPDRACVCEKPKPGTIVKWEPRIVEVTWEVLHNMDKSEWQAATKVMRDVENCLDTDITNKRWDIVSFFDDYPPTAVIRIWLKPGEGSLYAHKFTDKELEEAAALAMQACAPAMRAFPQAGLAVKLQDWRSDQGRNGLFYVLRPRDYRDMIYLGDA